jgi:two-component system, chemotaxis family, response regulator Rcp1
MKVLLVEDNPADVFLVQEAMIHEGVAADVDIAEDGEKAIHLVEALDRDSSLSGYSCFLIDMNLPRRSGAEVLRAIRGSVRCAASPVVMITSSEASADRDQAMQSGATRVFIKPFRLSEFRNLATLVRSLCNGQDRR